jgi:hypothetical protein
VERGEHNNCALFLAKEEEKKEEEEKRCGDRLLSCVY